MADLEQYKQMTEKEESESQSRTHEPLANVAIIEEIMADQTKFSAYVSTIMEEEQKQLKEDDQLAAATR